MRVAITAGTGFVGRHLARNLVERGHEAVLIARGKDLRDESVYRMNGTAFFRSDLSDPKELRRAFSSCDAVAHCAGINREIGGQTYKCVHIEGTRNVVEAARLASVRKLFCSAFCAQGQPAVRRITNPNGPPKKSCVVQASTARFSRQE